MSTGKTVVTHSGKFHADDVFSIAILKQVYGESVEVIRTRDTETIAGADIVVDVGGIYDVASNRFDHHQTEGAGTRENDVPYASCGLIWKHFGQEICRDEEVWKYIDERLIQPLDAGDTGYTISKSLFDDVHEVSLAESIAAFNPTLLEGHEHADDYFAEAVVVAQKILERFLKRAELFVQGKKEIEAMYQQAEDKRIIELSTPYPWKNILTEYPEPRIVFFQDQTSRNWYAQAVPKEEESFETRISFPKNWAGLSDENLQEVSGVADAVFCHRNLFLVVAKSRTGVLELIEKTLEK